jgi:anthranilate synthase/aminodeoxychorismate synthase-like glutamine amidotransferase
MQHVIPGKISSWKPDLPEGAGNGLSVGDVQHEGEASTARIARIAEIAKNLKTYSLLQDASLIRDHGPLPFNFDDFGNLGNSGNYFHQLNWWSRHSMVFVLDNYDSFTYNLVQYLGELGQKVEVRRNDQVTPAEIEAMRPERIVVSPGPCTPQKAGISIELIRHFTGKLPVLGVCLGHQAIGAAFGGNVVRAHQLMHGKTSQIKHDGKTLFRNAPQPMTATRYHSLIVSEEGLPAELEISAETREADGTRVIMGLRHRQFPVEGVQFHPESVLTESGRLLLQNFLAL